MRKLMMATGAALAMALAGCGDAAPEPGNQIEVAGPEATENAIENMPEGQRNAVFIRAILDAGQECQHVESSERAGTHQGLPVWNATCQGGGTWTIVIGNNGTAHVLNAEEARLVDTNETAAQNAQDGE